MLFELRESMRQVRGIFVAGESMRQGSAGYVFLWRERRSCLSVNKYQLCSKPCLSIKLWDIFVRLSVLMTQECYGSARGSWTACNQYGGGGNGKWREMEDTQHYQYLALVVAIAIAIEISIVDNIPPPQQP